jgi:proteasome lid subunit RPN8/RPN11
VSFSIRAIIRAFVAPEHKLRCSRALWRSICRELCERSEGRHESGCFLLGRAIDGCKVVSDTVYYDELDPNAYASGVCILKANSFGKLWKICRERDLDVVADIHTHLFSANQSQADRTNPMIAEKGYIALIAPQLCCKRSAPADMNIYEYQGAHRWIDHSSCSGRIFYVGRWA